MGMMPAPVKCFLTGRKADNISGPADLIEYSIDYRGRKTSFRFSVEDWESKISGEVLNVLKAMLYTNQWPIDQETIITPKLLDSIIQDSVYPKSFPDKMHYFLECLYKNGGNEYIPQNFSKREHLVAFAKNEDEFSRLFEGLASKKYITYDAIPTHRKDATNPIDFGNVKLTEDGIQKAELIIKERKARSDKYQFPTNKLPQVMICGVDSDTEFFKKLQQCFLGHGFSVQPVLVNKSNEHSTILNSRGKINSGIDYFVFIKSIQSDTNNSAGEIATMAMGKAIDLRGKFQFFFYGYIDDSDIKNRPSLLDFPRVDFRLKASRELLISWIKEDWVKRCKYFEEEAAQRNKEYFNPEELKEMHKKIDRILQKLDRNEDGQEILFEEIQELKDLVKTMKKKHWKEVLMGKLGEAVTKGIITKVVASDMYKDLTGHFTKLLE